MQTAPSVFPFLDVRKAANGFTVQWYDIQSDEMIVHVATTAEEVERICQDRITIWCAGLKKFLENRARQENL